MTPSAKEGSYESQSLPGRNPKTVTLQAIALGLTVGTENVAYDVCTRITRRVAVAKAFADFQSEVTHQLDLQIRTPFPSWARIFVFAFCQEAEAKQPSRRR